MGKQKREKKIIPIEILKKKKMRGDGSEKKKKKQQQQKKEQIKNKDTHHQNHICMVCIK